MTKYVLAVIIALIGVGTANAQTFASYGNTPSLGTYAEVMAGSTTTNAITLQMNNFPGNTNLASGWSIRVKANGNFTNGSSSIPSQYVALRLASTVNLNGVAPTGAVPLTNTSTSLTNTSAALQTPPVYYAELKLDLIIQGGNHMLVPTTGTYTASVAVSLVNAAGTVQSTGSINVSFNINFSNTCSGVRIGGNTNNAYNFDTYAKTLSGGTVTEGLTIQYSPGAANCRGWKVKVRANGNFVNGANSISPQFFALRFNKVSQGAPSAAAIGVTNAVIPLGLTDVDLISGSNAAFESYNYTIHQFDLILQGGNHFSSLPSGNYTSSLTVSVYNQADQFVNSANISINFQVSWANSFSATITLQNPDVSFVYDLPSKYVSGISISKPNGLKIVAYNAHQVIVKTLGPNLVNGSQTLPVSVINLENTPPAGKPSITATTVTLSGTDQRIILNTVPNSNYHTIEYNLRYFISGNNTTVASAGSGTYSTQLIYVILPL